MRKLDSHPLLTGISHPFPFSLGDVAEDCSSSLSEECPIITAVLFLRDGEGAGGPVQMFRGGQGKCVRGAETPPSSQGHGVSHYRLGN